MCLRQKFQRNNYNFWPIQDIIKWLLDKNNKIIQKYVYQKVNS